MHMYDRLKHNHSQVERMSALCYFGGVAKVGALWDV